MDRPLAALGLAGLLALAGASCSSNESPGSGVAPAAEIAPGEAAPGASASPTAAAAETADASPQPETPPSPPPPEPNLLPKTIVGFDWSADSKLVALAQGANVVVLDTVGHGQKKLGPLSSRPTTVAFAPSGDIIAIGEKDGRVELWNARSGELVRSIETPHPPSGIRFARDGKLALAFSENESIRVFRPATGEVVRDLQPDWYVSNAAFFGGGGYLAAVDGSVLAATWDLSSDKEPQSGSLDTGGTFPAVLSPDAVWFASAATDGHGLRAWSAFPIAEKKQLMNVQSCNEHIVSLAFSRDGKMLLAGLQNGTRFAFHSGAWTMRSRWVPPPGVAEETVASSPSDDGEMIAIATEKAHDDARPNAMKVRVFSTAGGSALRQMEGHERIEELRMSPDSHYLLGMVRDTGTARVWAVGTGKTVAQL